MSDITDFNKAPMKITGNYYDVMPNRENVKYDMSEGFLKTELVFFRERRNISPKDLSKKLRLNHADLLAIERGLEPSVAWAVYVKLGTYYGEIIKDILKPRIGTITQQSGAFMKGGKSTERFNIQIKNYFEECLNRVPFKSACRMTCKEYNLL